MDLEQISANKTARNLGMIYFLLSAITSFAFFFTYFPQFLPLPYLGEWAEFIEPAVSGLIGVALFDYAAVKWLQIYLHGCDNNDQRSTARTAFWFGFVGSAASSFAYIFLTSNRLFAIPDNLRWWLSVGAVLIISVSVVFNFYSKISFDEQSNSSKLAIREAERRGRIQKAEEEEADHLDALIEQKVKEKLAAEADSLAEEQARRVVARRVEMERAKGAERGMSAPLRHEQPQTSTQHNGARPSRVEVTTPSLPTETVDDPLA